MSRSAGALGPRFHAGSHFETGCDAAALLPWNGQLMALDTNKRFNALLNAMVHGEAPSAKKKSSYAKPLPVIASKAFPVILWLLRDRPAK